MRHTLPSSWFVPQQHVSSKQCNRLVVSEICNQLSHIARPICTSLEDNQSETGCSTHNIHPSLHFFHLNKHFATFYCGPGSRNLFLFLLGTNSSGFWTNLILVQMLQTVEYPCWWNMNMRVGSILKSFKNWSGSEQLVDSPAPGDANTDRLNLTRVV